MFAAAEKLNWEGIISKRADAPYRSGDRSDSWQKIKTSRREQFHIVGFVPALGGIAGLHVARRESKNLTYVGKVGTGFSYKTSADLRRRLDALPPPKEKLAMKRHIRTVEAEADRERRVPRHHIGRVSAAPIVQGAGRGLATWRQRSRRQHHGRHQHGDEQRDQDPHAAGDERSRCALIERVPERRPPAQRSSH
nr:hypothetical protein [Bradyrhizobium sp. 174]